MADGTGATLMLVSRAEQEWHVAGPGIQRLAQVYAPQVYPIFYAINQDSNPDKFNLQNCLLAPEFDC